MNGCKVRGNMKGSGCKTSRQLNGGPWKDMDANWKENERKRMQHGRNMNGTKCLNAEVMESERKWMQNICGILTASCTVRNLPIRRVNIHIVFFSILPIPHSIWNFWNPIMKKLEYQNFQGCNDIICRLDLIQLPVKGKPVSTERLLCPWNQQSLDDCWWSNHLDQWSLFPQPVVYADA